MADMWFGTRGSMRWVPCASVDSQMGPQNWGVTTEYLNGGAHVRHSKGSHMRYNLAWPLSTRAAIRSITDYADGIYGDGLIYWSDPFNMDTNAMPLGWSWPAQGAYDGYILNGTYVRPTITATPANANGYPVESAVYTMAGTAAYSVWIPIPPGYTLHIGAHGSASGGTVRVTPTNGVGVGTTTVLTLLNETTTTRVNHSVPSSTGDGVLVQLGGTGTITLSGIIAQVLPTGVSPEAGGYISGKGHTGCRFERAPQPDYYSAAMDLVGLSANLIEVGAWL